MRPPTGRRRRPGRGPSGANETQARVFNFLTLASDWQSSFDLERALSRTLRVLLSPRVVRNDENPPSTEARAVRCVVDHSHEEASGEEICPCSPCRSCCSRFFFVCCSLPPYPPSLSPLPAVSLSPYPPSLSHAPRLSGTTALPPKITINTYVQAQAARDALSALKQGLQPPAAAVQQLPLTEDALDRLHTELRSAIATPYTSPAKHFDKAEVLDMVRRRAKAMVSPATESGVVNVVVNKDCPWSVFYKTKKGKDSAEAYALPSHALQDGWIDNDVTGVITQLPLAHRIDVQEAPSRPGEKETFDFLIEEQPLVGQLTNFVRSLWKNREVHLGRNPDDAKRSQFSRAVNLSHGFLRQIIPRRSRVQRDKGGASVRASLAGTTIIAGGAEEHQDWLACAVDVVLDQIDAYFKELRNRPLPFTGFPLASSGFVGSGSEGTHEFLLEAGKRANDAFAAVLVVRLSLTGIRFALEQGLEDVNHPAVRCLVLHETKWELDDRCGELEIAEAVAAKTEFELEAAKKTRGDLENRVSAPPPAAPTVSTSAAAPSPAAVSTPAAAVAAEPVGVAGRSTSYSPEDVKVFKRVMNAVRQQCHPGRRRAGRIPTDAVALAASTATAGGASAGGASTAGAALPAQQRPPPTQQEPAAAVTTEGAATVLQLQLQQQLNADLVDAAVRVLRSTFKKTKLVFPCLMSAEEIAQELLVAAPLRKREVWTFIAHLKYVIEIALGKDETLFLSHPDPKYIFKFGLQEWTADVRAFAKLQSDRATLAALREDVRKLSASASSARTNAAARKRRADEAREEVDKEMTAVRNAFASRGALPGDDSVNGRLTADKVFTALGLASPLQPLSAPGEEAGPRSPPGEGAGPGSTSAAAAGAAATAPAATRAGAAAPPPPAPAAGAAAPPAPGPAPAAGAAAPLAPGPAAGAAIPPHPAAAATDPFVSMSRQKRTELRRAAEIVKLEEGDKGRALEHARKMLDFFADLVDPLLSPEHQKKVVYTRTAEGAVAAAPAVPLSALLHHFWAVEDAVRKLFDSLNSLLLFGTSMNVFAKLMGCASPGEEDTGTSLPPGGEVTGMSLKPLSPLECSTAVHEAEEEDGQLGKAWRRALNTLPGDKRSRLFAKDTAFFALEEENGADGERNGIRHFNLARKITNALDLLRDGGTFSEDLPGLGQETITKVVKAIAAAVKAHEGDAPPPAAVTAAAAATGGDASADVLVVLRRGAAALEGGDFVSEKGRETAVTSLVHLTSKLRRRCQLEKEHLGLLLRGPPSQARRLFDSFLSTAVSRHLLYEVSHQLGEEMNESGLPRKTLTSILALAPLCEPGLPAPLIILRSALLSSADVVCLADSDKPARRLTELLFPNDARQGASPGELEAVIGAVRIIGRRVLATAAHGRSANDPVAWRDLFTEPSQCDFKTGFAKRVTLAASEAPISMIQSLWTVRWWGLLVLRDEDKLQLSEVLEAGEGASTDSAKPRLDVRCGWSLWRDERIHASSRCFGDASPDRAFVSTKAASGKVSSEMVLRPARVIAGVGQAPWSGPACAGKKPVSLFFLDEAVTAIQLDGYRFCHSVRTDHRAGGNGQMTCIRNDTPNIVMEIGGVFAFYGTASDLRVSSCPLASLPCFQVVKTWAYLNEREYDELGEEGIREREWEARVEESSARQEKFDPAGRGAGTDAAARADDLAVAAKQALRHKLEVVSVDVHGCPPYGRSAGGLNRRLLSMTVRCLALHMHKSTELFCVADWNKCMLDPVDLATTVFQFLVPTFNKRPSLQDLKLIFLLGFSGYGGSPGGWRSIDGRLGFRIEDGDASGTLSLRLDADLVQHVRNHGLVEHLSGTDHGALRWSIVPRSRAPAPGREDPDFEGPVWEAVSWFVGNKSLSSAHLPPLTLLEKATLKFCVASSRLYQFQLRGRLDFLASDVIGRPVAEWGTALLRQEEVASESLRGLGAEDLQRPEALREASAGDEKGAEERGDDEEVGKSGVLGETFSEVEGEWPRPTTRREQDDDELLADGRMD